MTYLRVFAIFLIFASPILATLYFYPTLDRFNKVTYHIPLRDPWVLGSHILRT
jgi:hypothetical protein